MKSKFIKRALPLLINNPLTNLIDKRAQIDTDLKAVTSYGRNEEVAAEQVEMSEKGVSIIWKYVEDLYLSGVSPAITFCLRKNGKVVLNRAIGHSHGSSPTDSGIEKRLMTPETPTCQFSASKAVTAMLIHLLDEQGKLSLNDAVVKYIPEFAMNDKEHITILQVLAHQSGLPSFQQEVTTDILFDHEQCLDILCKAPQERAKSNSHAYHAVTGGVILGEIIRRVSDMEVREFLDQSITKPLGLKYFNFGIAEDEISDVAINCSTGKPFYPISAVIKNVLGASWGDVIDCSNMDDFFKATMPSVNLISTADEMSQFYQLLLNKGELNGVRIFKPETVIRATQAATDWKMDGSMFVPMRYSAGHMLGGSPIGLWGMFSEQAFGHVGFINNLSWADPERDISVSLQTTGKSLLGGHLLILSQLLLAISWHYRN